MYLTINYEGNIVNNIIIIEIGPYDKLMVVKEDKIQVQRKV